MYMSGVETVGVYVLNQLPVPADQLTGRFSCVIFNNSPLFLYFLCRSSNDNNSSSYFLFKKCIVPSNKNYTHTHTQPKILSLYLSECLRKVLISCTMVSVLTYIENVS